LGIGDWGLGPIPNPQSPIPNPQSPMCFILIYININLFINFIINILNNCSCIKLNKLNNE